MRFVNHVLVQLFARNHLILVILSVKVRKNNEKSTKNLRIPLDKALYVCYNLSSKLLYSTCGGDRSCSKRE